MIRSIASLAVLLALGTASFAADPASRPARDDSASEKLGLKLGLQCYTFRSLTFFETVDLAAKMGIKYLEIYPGQTLKPGSKTRTGANLNDEEIAEIKKKLADAGGLKIIAIGVDGIPTDEAGARKRFEWAKKVGIEVLNTETAPNAAQDKLAQEFNIRISIHNHPNSWPPEKVLEACKGLSKMVGSGADTGHWKRAKRVPVEVIKMLDGRITHSHLKDLDDKNGDVPFGTGVCDIKGILAELKNQGVKCYMNIEYERTSGQQLIDNVAKCVENYDKICAEIAGK